MNHIPLFIAIVLLSLIAIIVLGWRQEQRFSRRPSSRQIEPNMLLLSELAILTILVLVVSAIFLLWGVH